MALFSALQIGVSDFANWNKRLPGLAANSACYDEYAENFSLAHFWVKSPIYVLLFLAQIITQNMDSERKNLCFSKFKNFEPIDS
jgi:hypothetical protein